MDYFKNFCSNTCAGSANQYYFNSDGEKKTGRIFYKIFKGGKYNYSFLFSNIIDSTYSDGSVSHSNLICSSWKIHHARIGKCVNLDNSKDTLKMLVANEIHNIPSDIIVTEFKDLKFSGTLQKNVMPGEFFCTDEIEYFFEKGDYLCLEITFSGKMIPYHEESLLPVYVNENGNWKYSKLMPFPAMIGCDRKVKGKIAYLGDSITQGIGTPNNSYLHWNALLSEKLGTDYSYWNLGIGWGRAFDAATDSAWLYKAKQNDIVFVCLGVNDIYHYHNNYEKIEENLKKNLTSIVNILKKEGIKVILQTIPPFNYKDKQIDVWKNVNNYIKTVLCDKVDAVFDNNPCLWENESLPQNAKYGGHPDATGCSVWADALYSFVKDIIL